MITSKEADENFVKNYGKEDSASFIPSSVTTAVADLKATIDSSSINDDVRNPEYTKVLIDEAIYAYSELAAASERNGRGKVVSEPMSLITLACSHVYDEEMCNFFTKDSANNNRNPLSSRFTYLVKRASDDIAANKEDASLPESLGALINTVIEYFDPRAVSKVLESVIPTCGESGYFTDERVRGYFEALVMRENVVYGNTVNSINNLVWIKYIRLINLSAMDVLTNKVDVYWAEKNGVREYALIKDIMTQIVIDGIFKSDVKSATDILRYMRENVTSWIKHKDLSERRPNCPEVFDLIDMNSFMSSLYTMGIHAVGNTKELVNKFDSIIETYEKQLKESKTEDDKANINRQLEGVKSRKTEYLTFKSLIAFFIQECTSNELVAYKAFSPDVAVEYLIKEPPLDFGMNDSNSCVGSLFSKRDFTPIGSTPINPYYLHYGIGDISSPEADYMAYSLSSLVHPGMKSIIALAGSKNFATLQITIESVKEALVRAKEIASDEIIGSINRLKSFDKDNTFAIPEDCKSFEKIAELLEGFKSKCSEMLKEENGKSEDPIPSNQMNIRKISVDIDSAYSTAKWYLDYVASAKNILSQIEYVIDSISSEQCMSSAHTSISEEKPLKNFWPITQQYEYEIEEPDGHAEYETPLEPGDIERHRYGSRFTTQHPCD